MYHILLTNIPLITVTKKLTNSLLNRQKDAKYQLFERPHSINNYNLTACSCQAVININHFITQNAMQT